MLESEAPDPGVPGEGMVSVALVKYSDWSAMGRVQWEVPLGGRWTVRVMPPLDDFSTCLRWEGFMFNPGFPMTLRGEKVVL